ncbi:MAG: hypothetical protein ACK4Z5_05440 [Brevundimonas sp.]
MALLIDRNMPGGVVAAYHRLKDVRTIWPQSPRAGGPRRYEVPPVVVKVSVESYRDAAARAQGEPPLLVQTYDLPNQPLEPSRAEIYQALLDHPHYQGAVSDDEPGDGA